MFRDHGWLFERAINHFEETKTFIDDNTNCHNERVTIIMQFMPGKFYRTVEKRSWWSWSMADSDYHAKNSHKWLFKIHFYLRILVFPQSLTLNIPACFYGTFKLRLRRNIRLRQQMHKRLSALFPRLGKKIVVVFYHKMRFLQTLSNTFANNFFRFEIDPASEIGTLCVAVYPRESHWQRLLTIQKLIISENVTKTFALTAFSVFKLSGITLTGL